MFNVSEYYSAISKERNARSLDSYDGDVLQGIIPAVAATFPGSFDIRARESGPACYMGREWELSFRLGMHVSEYHSAISGERKARSLNSYDGDVLRDIISAVAARNRARRTPSWCPIKQEIQTSRGRTRLCPWYLT